MTAVLQKISRRAIRTLRQRGYLETGIDAAMATGYDPLRDNEPERVRTMQHLVSVVQTLGEKGTGFQSFTEAINTTTAGDKLVFHIMGALAEFERSLIAERSQAGQQAAKRRGTHIGCPRKLTQEQVAHASRMVRTGQETVSGMAALYGIDRVTMHRVLHRAHRP